MNEFSPPPSEPPPSRETPPKRQWYRVVVKAAHAGAAGTLGDDQETQVNYFYVGDAVEALKNQKRLRGWRRADNPNISPLTTEEEEILEEIIDEQKCPLGRAKRKGFYGRRVGKDGQITHVEELIKQRLKERQEKGR